MKKLQSLENREIAGAVQVAGVGYLDTVRRDGFHVDSKAPTVL